MSKRKACTLEISAKKVPRELYSRVCRSLPGVSHRKRVIAAILALDRAGQKKANEYLQEVDEMEREE